MESKSRPDGKVYSCASCGLYVNSKSPKMKPGGNFKKRILIIGEKSSKTDDRVNSQWRDRQGEFLRNTLTANGIDLYEDCLSTNAVPCYCEEDVTMDQVSKCRARLLKLIAEVKPVLIIPLGFCALYSLIGHRFKKDLKTIEKWRGWTIPDQDFHCWVCPTYHPGSIMDRDPEWKKVFELDIKQAILMLYVPFRSYQKPIIKVLEPEELSVLNEIETDFAFDYETTGIKPHAVGHRIVCCSIAVAPNLVYAFMMPKSPKAREPFINLLKNPKIGKIAQNMKFEHTWSLIRLKTKVENWIWDTMLASHILDNRPDVTGLKFQTYVQFGVVDYDSEISPYLRSNSTDGNALNNVIPFSETIKGKEKLLEYCALDSCFEFRLYQLQKSIIDGAI